MPKTFSAGRRFSFLTDLGFIVVQIDGMGTANRSKAFHDVCWHNLKDAGFPDRILWHQAVARKDPSYDLSRVGIYGTSAGGQNATGGVLFHPEFYKVAVSACGCHDNRMDKASWNEQWMGYPVGPWYSESSNIDNAQRLQGKLLLIVGEMDTNVPPESTMRLVDALIKAGKDFELLVVPGANHGMGGAYGQRRMRDFFVRHLLGQPVAEPGKSTARDLSASRASTGDVAAPKNSAAAHESSALSLDLEDMGVRSQRAARRDRALRGRPGQLAAVVAADGLAADATSAHARVHAAVARPAGKAGFRPPQPGRPGGLSAVQKPPRARAAADRSARREARRPARSSRSPAPSSTSTRRDAS